MKRILVRFSASRRQISMNFVDLRSCTTAQTTKPLVLRRVNVKLTHILCENVQIELN